MSDIKNRVNIALTCLSPFLCALLIQVSVLVFGTAFCLWFGFISSQLSFGSAILNVLYHGGPIHDGISIVAATICISIFAGWRKRLTRQAEHPIKKVLSAKLIALLVLLGISLQGIVTMVLACLSGKGDGTSDTVGQISALTIVYEVFFAPVSDELIFRSVMLDKCRGRLSMLAANMLQSFSFGLYHANLVQAIYAFALGLILGQIMIWFHSVLVPIALHMVINLAGNVTFLLPRDLVSYAPVILVICLAAVIFTMVWLKKMTVQPVWETREYKA